MKVKQRGAKGITFEKPKHREEFSLRECAMFQPWRFDLMIELDAHDPEPVLYQIYLRAPRPQDAQITGYMAFMLWEHGTTDVPPDTYPHESWDVKSYIYGIDEAEWDRAWEESKWPGYSCRTAGDPQNPTVFHIIKPGWDKRSGLLRGLGNSIIVPDTAAIKAVEAQKKALDRKLKK